MIGECEGVDSLKIELGRIKRWKGWLDDIIDLEGKGVQSLGWIGREELSIEGVE